MNLAFDLISPIINQFQLFILFILQTMHYLKVSSDQISKLTTKSNTKLQNQKVKYDHNIPN